MDMIQQSTALRPPSARYQWYVVFLLLAVSMCAYIDRLVVGLLIDPIKHELQISDTSAGVLVGLAFTLSYALMGLPLGRLVDRRPRNIVLGLALVLWSSCTMASGLAGTFWLIFIARIGVGAGEAAVNPSALSLIGSLFPRERVSLALSVFAVGIYGGGGLAIILGGQLTAYLSSIGPVMFLGEHMSVWRLIFLCVGLPGMFLAVLVIFTIRDRWRGETAAAESSMSVKETMDYLRRSGRLYPLLFLALGAFAFYTYALQGWYPAMLSRTYKLTPHEISLWYGIPYLIFGVSGAASAGPFVNWLRRRGHADATLLVGLGTTVLAFVPAVISPLMPTAFGCLACIAVVIYLAALQQSTGFSILVLVTPPHMRGVVAALYVLTLNMTSGAFGAVLVGVMADHIFGATGLGYGIIVIAIVGMPLAAVCFMISRPVYRHAVERLALAE